MRAAAAYTTTQSVTDNQFLIVPSTSRAKFLNATLSTDGFGVVSLSSPVICMSVFCPFVLSCWNISSILKASEKVT